MVDEEFLARIKRKPDLATPVALALGHCVVQVTTLRGCRGALRRVVQGYFEGARYTAGTVWPPGFDPVAAGARHRERE
jgi:hypothetical protein